MARRMDAPQSPRSALLASPAARLSRARQILEEVGRPQPTALGTGRSPVRDVGASISPLTPDDDAAPEPARPPSEAAPDESTTAADPRTRLALALMAGALRPFATQAGDERRFAGLRARLMAPSAPGEPSRLELGALGAALVGAAFIGTTIPGAQPVGAQPQPAAAIAAATPAAAPAAAAAVATSDDQPSATAADAAQTPAASSPGDTAATATPAATDDTSTAASDAEDTDDTSGDAGDGSDPLAGGGGSTTLARVALVMVHGDAPVRWATAPPGSPARTRAASGTTFTGLATLPSAPLATGLALVAGQPSNPATRSGCSTPTPLVPGTTDSAGVTRGTGCDYPADTPSLPGAIARDGRIWKAYVRADAPTEAAARLCHPDEGPDDARLAAQRSALAHLGDLAGSGACDAAAAPLSALASDLKAESAPAWVYVEVGDCGTDGCDAAETAARDADLDDALKALAAQAPADGGRTATIVVGDGDVADLEPAPAGSYPSNPSDPSAPPSVLSGALLIGGDVERDSTDPLALDPFAIARTQATWLGVSAPGQAAAEGVSALATPGA